ncbi:response regulator transcription factor [Granulosicoccus sp.]|nr:response regulator transcription factor [Granulosicoccus sp.]MDB4224016.1 response regulator transcription factor [Granulosicoccus sp.]
MISTLIVEDDYLIGHAVEQWLCKENRVRWARSLSEAQLELSENKFDIILLDIGLPDGSGIELLKYIRKIKSDAGVLVITAYSDVESRVEGLDNGADDYLVKPIDFKELDARIRAVTRRKNSISSQLITHGNLVFDQNGRTVSQDNKPVHLSKMEVSILGILMQGQNRYYSKAMLEERLYDFNNEHEGNAVEVHISSLRKKLGKSLIKTTRGLGYIIEKPIFNEQD